MNTHLNPEELTGLLLGFPAHGADSHLRACAECSRELAQMKKSIALFRQATRDWSESDISTPLSRCRTRLSLPAKSSRPLAGWVVAAAAIVLIAIPSFYLAQHIHGNGTAGVNAVASSGSDNAAKAALDPAQQLEQDNALLSQIDSAIAEGVPPSLQPLELSSSPTSSSPSSTRSNSNRQATSSQSR
jgi:hypothetical protein